MNKKFPIKIDDVFCEAKDLPKSSLVVELHYVRDLEENYKYLIQDTCDTDTYVRERVKGVLTEKEIDGDSYCVPSIENIVDSLCKIIENNKFKEMFNMAEDERIDIAKQLQSEIECHAKCQIERDELKNVLMKIATANHFDNIGNWARNTAKKALEGMK